MPSKAKALRATGPAQDDEPFLIEKRQELLPDERVELRKFFETVPWRKVVHNARLSRPVPSVNIPAALDNAESRRQLASEKLAEIRGWKMCEVAMAREVLTPEPQRIAPRDNYPDAGRVDAAAPK